MIYLKGPLVNIAKQTINLDGENIRENDDVLNMRSKIWGTYFGAHRSSPRGYRYDILVGGDWNIFLKMTFPSY